MTMTDPIADMLTRLRNANQAYHDAVIMPYSKLKAGVAEILQQEGYITSWKVEDNARRGRAVGKTLDRRPEVRPEPRALDRRHPPDQQARPARLRQAHRPAQGARRPRRRDHLDEPGPADRPSGEPEGRGWGSPRLRLVTTRTRRRHSMSRIGKLPIAVPSGVDVTVDGQHGHRQGPQGHPAHTVAAPITVGRADDGAHRGRAVPTTSARAVAARPDPHPDRQHGDRA